MGNGILSDTVRYVIGFLAGDGVAEELIERVCYAEEADVEDGCRVVIKPSGFFDDSRYGRAEYMPRMPFEEVDGIPILFGTPSVEVRKGVVYVKADVVASAYFFLSRYEEWMCPGVVDGHGRFPAMSSLLFRMGRLNRPIVEEYGVLLRGWMRMAGMNVLEPYPGYSHVYLTHDVDRPFYCRTLRAMAGIALRAVKHGRWGDVRTAVSSYFGHLGDDPHYVFSKMFSDDFYRTLDLGDRVKTVAFFKSPTGRFAAEDRPLYGLRSKDMRALRGLCRAFNVVMGLHASYLSGERPDLIGKEASRLRRDFAPKAAWCRSHFLRCVGPERMGCLVDAGITDDFTLGYAAVAGFRLGTCRAVNWINPATGAVERRLTLHPLLVMDCTLSADRYMNLNYSMALHYCRLLFEQVKRYGGEVVLLWHNQSLAAIEGGYHRKLYVKLLKEVSK